MNCVKNEPHSNSDTDSVMFKGFYQKVLFQLKTLVELNGKQEGIFFNIKG